MRTIEVAFTDEEFAAIEHVVGFVNRTGMETIDGEIGPSEWVRDVIVDRLGMARFQVVSSNSTNADRKPPHAFDMGTNKR